MHSFAFAQITTINTSQKAILIIASSYNMNNSDFIYTITNISRLSFIVTIHNGLLAPLKHPILQPLNGTSNLTKVGFSYLTLLV